MKKLTKLEKFWILYDVGNSAFTLLVSTIIPIYFNHLAELAGISEVDYLAYWGYAASLTTMIVAIIGPVVGTIADTEGYKKPLFILSMMVGVLGCAALSLPKSWVVFLAVFVVAKVGYSVSLIFYDAMLNDVTEPDRMDNVSSQGYAWGYIGSCIPFIVSIVVVLFTPLPLQVSMTIAFILNGAWWLLVTLPLLKAYKQKHFSPKTERPIFQSFKRLYEVFQDMKQNKNVLFFLLAFFMRGFKTSS